MVSVAIFLNAYVLIAALITVAVLAHFRGRDWFNWLCVSVAITPLWALVLVLGMPPVKVLDRRDEAGKEGVKIAAYVVLTLLAGLGAIILALIIGMTMVDGIAGL